MGAGVGHENDQRAGGPSAATESRARRVSKPVEKPPQRSLPRLEEKTQSSDSECLGAMASAAQQPGEQGYFRIRASAIPKRAAWRSWDTQDVCKATPAIMAEMWARVNQP